MINMIGMVVTIVAAIFTIYYIFSKKEKPMTVQDVIGRTAQVSPEGIARRGDMFRAVVEVRPINMSTSSKVEQDSVWINFRALINTLGIPYTMLVQSQYVDIKDYSQWYQETFSSNPFLTPELKESAEDVVRHINRLDGEKRTRDFRSYIILHYDPVAESIDSGVKTGSFLLDDLIDKASNRGSRMSEDEKEDLATQILQEGVQMIFAACEQLGMQYRRLERQGIYEMVYTTLQKELSASIRLSDAVEAQSFTPMIQSITSKLLAFEYHNEKGAS